MDIFNEFYACELLWSVCGMSVWFGLLSQVNWDGLKCFHNFSLNILQLKQITDETKKITHTHTYARAHNIWDSNQNENNNNINGNNRRKKKKQRPNQNEKPTKIPERSAHQDKIDTQFYKGENQMNKKQQSNTQQTWGKMSNNIFQQPTAQCILFAKQLYVVLAHTWSAECWLRL